MFWFSFAQSIEYFVLGLGFYWGCILINNGEMSLYQFFVSFMGLFFAGQNASTLFTYTSSMVIPLPISLYDHKLKFSYNRYHEGQESCELVLVDEVAATSFTAEAEKQINGTFREA